MTFNWCYSAEGCFQLIHKIVYYSIRRGRKDLFGYYFDIIYERLSNLRGRISFHDDDNDAEKKKG